MPDLTLRQLEYFVATVEEGSVSKAARRLHVSPGAVSLAVSDLESVLKLRLVMRQRGRGVTPTVGGREMLDHARQILGSTDAMANAAGAVRGELVGPLSVGCFTPLSPWLVPRLLHHFAAQHPGVTLDLVEGSWDDLTDRLRRGVLDVALLYSAHAADDLYREEVIEVAPRLLLPPEHPLAVHEEIPLADLRDEPAILLNIPPSGDIAESALSAVGFTPRVAWRSSNVETVRSMVARGLGYTINMGRPSGNRTFDGLPIAYRGLADSLPHNAVVAARAPGATSTVKVDTFIAAARLRAGATS